jgi:ATP-dependent protease HslVU (ClpYQ) peptidase subunit
MSVVAVKRLKDKIVMSADNQVTIGWGNKVTGDEISKEPAKIFRNENMLVGTAGYTYAFSLFRIYCKNRKPASANVEGILEFLSEFLDWAKKKDSDFKLNNDFLIVFEDHIFHTDCLDVNEINEFSAIGCGMFLALGALSQGASTEEAIKVAIKYDTYCGGDVITYEMLLKDGLKKDKK